ncbi:hypothetical protein JHK87_025027 [Glycine soja]|nr:hypothetical protein JHK87_025027 [Glycine soja]
MEQRHEKELTKLKDDHDKLEARANLYSNDDRIICCVFPTSLKGAVLTWYGGLPPRSVDIFSTLVERFSMQYATTKSHHMTSIALASLRQADDESLKKFIDRFGHTTTQI